MPDPTRTAAALAIETEGLVKTFGPNRAVDGVTLTVPTGVVYGVLGPNGAGKTTTIRMLATLLKPDAGTARVLGHDVIREPDAVRSRVSLTGQFASLDEDLTGLENLTLLARLWGYRAAAAKRRADDLLAAFDLTDAAARQVKHYSGGMRRRIDIAASLVVTPDLIFLDEPTTGLDPRSRNQVWEIVRTLVAEGTTVLLTTQYLEEADQLADRVAVIDHGKVIAEGTTGELKASVGAGSLHIRLHDAAHRPHAIAQLIPFFHGAVAPETDPVAITVRLDGNDHVRVGDAYNILAAAGTTLSQFALGQPSLDEVFLTLTGRPAADPTDDESLTQEETAA
ncbi:MAG: ATP-binding cassette domain-containing protein [Thermomicrobiales bacterium]